MRAMTPILMCDDEDGCSEYTTDYYEMCATNWRELMEPGWAYDPYRSTEDALCPEHAPTAPHPPLSTTAAESDTATPPERESAAQRQGEANG